MFKELLIPYHGDPDDCQIKPMVYNSGDAEVDEEKRRELRATMLAEAIMFIEKKHVTERRQLAKL